MLYITSILQATSYLWKLLDANQPEAKLLRVVTLLANIVCFKGDNSLSSVMMSSRQPLAPVAATPDDKEAAFLNGAAAGASLLSHT